MNRRFFSSFLSQKKEILRQQLEEKIKVSELRYRRLFEAAQDGILILDADSGQIEDVNPYLQEILGYSQTELIGKQLWEIGVFKDIIDSKKAFQELQIQGYIRYKDLPLKTKAGRVVDVEFVSNVYMVGTRKVIQCNIRDITDRRKVEEAIKSRTLELEKLSKEQEAAKHAMLNVMEDLEEAKAVIEIEKAKDEATLASIGEGLISVDNNCKVVTINKSAEKMLGWKMKDIVGREITSLPLEDEEGKIIPPTKRPTYLALTTGKSITATYFFVRKDKSRFPVAITVTPIKLGGKTIGALDTFRDITREKAIDKAKSEFVSLASHQLRTPLGITKWYLEALANEDYFTKAPKVLRKYFDEIYKSNEHVLSLVRDLLSVSRIDQERVKNTPQSINIPVMVQELVEQMQIVAHKRQITLKVAIQEQPIPSITIDSLRFREVIENLIANAIEYTLVDGLVEVTVSQAGDTILISIKDNGIGISVEDQKQLFTKFFRGQKAIRHNPEGSGLGLYVVKSYVEGWGGKITAESTEKNGSTFTISLPITSNNDQVKAPESFSEGG